MKVREVLRILHEDKPGIVVVPGNAGDDIPIGTLKAIFKQAQIEEQK